jgi:hypothetical protein
MRLTDIYKAQADDIADALEGEPVVLAGMPGTCRSEFLAELRPSLPRLHLRPARAGTAAALRADAAQALVRLLHVASGTSGRGQFNVLLAETFRTEAGRALAVARGEPDADLSFAEIVDAIPAATLVVVHDAHLLTEGWSERALWTLRARAQRPNSPQLALVTRPWHLKTITGRDAAFFGFAQAFELAPPELPRWMELTDYDISPDDLAWLLKQTRGLPGPTSAVLNRLGRDATDIRAAWALHVAEGRSTAVCVDRLAHGLHPYGPRLLAAIAADKPVYPAVPGARTDAIAAALRVMRDHDLIYQPVRRRWVIANPALVSHFGALNGDHQPLDAS